LYFYINLLFVYHLLFQVDGYVLTFWLLSLDLLFLQHTVLALDVVLDADIVAVVCPPVWNLVDNVTWIQSMKVPFLDVCAIFARCQAVVHVIDTRL